MAKIENTALGARHIHVQTDKLDPATNRKIIRNHVVPAAARDEGGKIVNGVLEMDDKLLARALEDDVVKAWFESGELVIVRAPAPVAKDKANSDKPNGEKPAS